MIAEKTADAIRGRKLTPFEPPTRVATAARYPYSQVPDSAIHYKPPPLPPANSRPPAMAYHGQPAAHRQEVGPPPLGQQPNYLFQAPDETRAGDSESHYAGSLAGMASELANATAAGAGFYSDHPTFIQERSSQSSTSKRPGDNKRRQRLGADLSPAAAGGEFIHKHYAASTMVDNLIKRLGAIR